MQAGFAEICVDVCELVFCMCYSGFCLSHGDLGPPQADIMHHLHLLTHHYVAVAMSLKTTRTLDAARMLVMGCIACISDCVMRTTAVDRPSKLSLQYKYCPGSCL